MQRSFLCRCCWSELHLRATCLPSASPPLPFSTPNNSKDKLLEPAAYDVEKGQAYAAPSLEPMCLWLSPGRYYSGPNRGTLTYVGLLGCLFIIIQKGLVGGKEGLQSDHQIPKHPLISLVPSWGTKSLPTCIFPIMILSMSHKGTFDDSDLD